MRLIRILLRRLKIGLKLITEKPAKREESKFCFFPKELRVSKKSPFLLSKIMKRFHSINSEIIHSLQNENKQQFLTF